MSRRFFELGVRARRLVTKSLPPVRSARRSTARRRVGEELTQFSFRLALIIDLAYVGIGALGGAAIGRATLSPASAQPATCGFDNRVEPHLSIPRETTSDSSSTTMPRVTGR